MIPRVALAACRRATLCGAGAVWALCVMPGGPARAQAARADSAGELALLHSACGAAASAGALGAIGGAVRDAVDRSPVAAAVTVEWLVPAAAAVHGRQAGSRVTLGALTDSAGRWHVCGVPTGTPLSVRAAADEGSDQREDVRLDGLHPETTLDLSVRPLAETPGARAARTSALVVFTVADRAGNALAGVNLELAPASGPSRQVVTDSSGSAMVPAAAPGRALVRARGIGYRPGDLFIPLDAGRNTVPLILDPVQVPVLQTVRVIGDREVLPRHREFEMRRSLGLTTVSITADDIARRNPVETWQMLANVPSMRVTQVGSELGVFAYSTRGERIVQDPQTLSITSAPCFYRLMIDGVPLPDSMPDLSRLLPSPGDVHGIEVFAGLATVPPQYSGFAPDGQGGSRSSACGLIAVWTK